MLKFILNNEEIETDVPSGMTVLDFVRYRQNLKGTKIGCREGDCGACTILVGELKGNGVKYQSMTSCLMPVSNARGKHLVTVEGINRRNGDLTPVQKALVDESGTQCGFCTVGFVMSMTGFCIDETEKSKKMAISAVDGNICRCTGYKSIQRACERFGESSVEPLESLTRAVEYGVVPEYFTSIQTRLQALRDDTSTPIVIDPEQIVVGGGTDLYVQKHEEMVDADAAPFFDVPALREIEVVDGIVEIGASVTVTDLLESSIMLNIFPNLFKHLKLVSSTPIRNMATLAGNFVNASPIGDMTVWFLALNAEIELTDESNNQRRIPLNDLYLGYKSLAKSEKETIRKIRFGVPSDAFRFNFEKVSKRTYLDIATVNTAISLNVGRNNVIESAHVAAGGVSPIPLYLSETSRFLEGAKITHELVSDANKILQAEISPISDVRGSEDYKRLLLRQLFSAHFVELFSI